jgi:phosphoserine phosphatase RsbU/P
MVFPNERRIGNEQSSCPDSIHRSSKPSTSKISRIARELSAGRFRAGERLDLRAIAKEYQIDFDLLLEAFVEFQSLGMVGLSEGFSAVVYPPKDSQDVTILERFKRSASTDSGEYRAMRRDIEGAKYVQQSFFPARNISIPCIGSETFYQPAYGLGGDYYDILQLQGGRWGIAIGDVSGKGISAALIMASLHATLRAQAFHPQSDPSSLVKRVNRLVHDSSPPDFFVSLFYAEYEPATRILEYVNAGHHPPVVIRSQNGSTHAFYLKSTDVPIGISPRSQFPAVAFQLHIDDLLVAYTDGITEMENRDGEMYGLPRLERLLISSAGATAEQVIDGILEDVSSFADGQPQRDDITLVAIRVQPGCEA